VKFKLFSSCCWCVADVAVVAVAVAVADVAVLLLLYCSLPFVQSLHVNLWLACNECNRNELPRNQKKDSGCRRKKEAAAEERNSQQQQQQQQLETYLKLPI